MNTDPIIEELHRIREEIAAQFNYDVFAIGAALRAEQQDEDRPIVSFSDQPSEPENQPTEIMTEQSA
jgi:hypothetical protein